MKQTEKYYSEIKESEIPSFIWGGKEMGYFVKEKLNVKKVAIEGVVVDDSYASDILEEGVLTRSFVIKQYKKYNIICGNMPAFYKSEEELRSHWPGCNKIYFFPDVFDEDFVESFDEDFCYENRNQFDLVKSTLYDEFSKKSLDAYIEEKLTGNYKLILSYVIVPQYFFDNVPWKYEDNEVLLDCGAYDGDSIENFIKTVHNYEGIIACEPDENNYEKLLFNIEKNNWKDVIPYKIGISNEKKTLVFNSSGSMYSRIADGGNKEIHVDSIDHILNGKRVSIIKMDIEGSEMDALNGAEETIKNHRPMLMISAYHKRDDIYNIFQYINSKVENYSYFFRCHRPYPVDAVLYGIPNERIC